MWKSLQSDSSNFDRQKRCENIHSRKFYTQVHIYTPKCTHVPIFMSIGSTDVDYKKFCPSHCRLQMKECLSCCRSSDGKISIKLSSKFPSPGKKGLVGTWPYKSWAHKAKIFNRIDAPGQGRKVLKSGIN